METGKVLSGFLLDEKLKLALKVQAAKERKDMSMIVEELVKKYIEEHADGNPAFTITKWVDQSDFKVTPAFLETREKWDSYLKKCNRQELAQVEGKAIVLRRTAHDLWLEKRE